MNDRVWGALLVALSATAFGAMAIFARFAYADGTDVVAVLFLRFTIAAALMSAFVVASGRRWPRGRNLAILLAMGAVGYVGQSLSFFSALNHASAGLVALLLYLHPFLVTLLAALVLRRPLDRRRLLAVGVALAGTALTLGGGIDGKPLGVLLGVLAALIYSIYIIAGSTVLTREDPLAAATVVMIAAAAVFGGAVLATTPVFPAAREGWLAVLAIALLCTAVAMGAFFAGVRTLGPADAATLSTLEPVVTIVLAAIFLGEPLQPHQFAGGTLILAAVVWLARAGPAGTRVEQTT
jgi:drug/metabolite transporter (DMT)-like permease